MAATGSTDRPITTVCNSSAASIPGNPSLEIAKTPDGQSTEQSVNFPSQAIIASLLLFITIAQKSNQCRCLLQPSGVNRHLEIVRQRGLKPDGESMQKRRRLHFEAKVGLIESSAGRLQGATRNDEAKQRTFSHSSVGGATMSASDWNWNSLRTSTAALEQHFHANLSTSAVNIGANGVAAAGAGGAGGGSGGGVDVNDDLLWIKREELRLSTGVNA